METKRTSAPTRDRQPARKTGLRLPLTLDYGDQAALAPASLGMGRDLYLLTDNGRNTVTVRTPHEGTDSPATCGDNSDYEVTYTIKPL